MYPQPWEREKAIIATIPMVWSIVRKRYATLPRWIDRWDLFQAGMEGVTRAADRWRPELSSWSTYAYQGAYGYIHNEVRRLHHATSRLDPITPDIDLRPSNLGTTEQAMSLVTWAEMVRALPPRMSRLLMEHYVGITAEEQAERLGIPRQSVHTRMHTAQKVVKRHGWRSA